MPRINQNGYEENNEGLETKIEDVLPTVIVGQNPVVICGVNRRVGLAHYEHVDLYMGVALPMDAAVLDDFDRLRESIAEVANFAFNAASQETYARYKLLTDSQKNLQEGTPS